MPPEDRTRILHMIEAADAVASFIAGRKRKDLDDDLMLLFAPGAGGRGIRRSGGKGFGCNAGRPSGIPWPLIVATRNRLIHACFDIDRNILWKAATEEIPALVPMLKMLVDN